MSALSVHASRGLAAARSGAALRLALADAGRRLGAWHMKRNCSFAPRQLLGVYLACARCRPGHRRPVLVDGRAVRPAVRRRRAARRRRRDRRLRPPCRRPREHDAGPGRLSVDCTLRPARPSRSISSRRLGPGRARASRRLADRAVGRGPAHRRRPLRAPRAAPRSWPTNCARRCAGRRTSRPPDDRQPEEFSKRGTTDDDDSIPWPSVQPARPGPRRGMRRSAAWAVNDLPAARR